MKFVAKHKVEIALLLVLIAFYFLLRLPNLTLQPIFADEAIYIRWAQVMRAESTLRFLPLSDGKTPLFMWAMIPLFKIFQDPLFAGRFLSIISGFFTLMGVFFLSKKVFNLKVALWASLFYAIAPYTVFFDRMALVDSMVSAFTIWIIYFALWLVQKVRLDLGLILGFILGGAWLAKTPAVLNLLLLPISILTFKRVKEDKHNLLKLFLFWGVSILIALVMYNLLRLGPNFHLLSSRNADYVFSPIELSGRPLDPFIPHFHDMSDWFPKLFTWPILVLVGVGIFYAITKLNRLGLVVLLWAVVPLLFSMAFLKTYTARYLLPSIAPFLVFAGFGLTKILGQVKIKNSLKILVALIVVLPFSLRFDYQLIKNPPPDDLPKEERKGYFEEWTAGYGLKKIAEYLEDQKKNDSVVVGTEGFFGTLPDGLQIYLDKSQIPIIGSHAIISAQIKAAAKDHSTYFVGNKKNIVGSIDNVRLILEFPKAAPKDNSKQDAMMLYQVLP